MSNKANEKTIKSRLLGEEYTLIKHESGLTVCVFPKKMSVTYAIITTKFGSLDSRFRTDDGVIHQVPDGVAHFLEHKMFENPDGEDTFEKFSRTGADANALTSLRDTSYVFSCTENVGESLKILLGSVFTPYFTEENVKKEQGIIAQEINMGDDDPGSVLFLDLMNCLYSRCDIRTDVAGTVESIMKITPDILYECYRAFYLPENMTLCVCGDVSPDEVIAAVSETVPSGLSHPALSLYPDEPEEIVKNRSEQKMTVAKPLFSIGIKDTDISDSPDERMKKSAAMRLIASVYFGKSGDFYGKLLSKGLISPSFSCWCQHNELFSFAALSGDSDEPERVFEEFTAYLAKITDKPIPRDDFERARRAMYSRFVKGFDSTEEIATGLVCGFAIDGGDIFRYAEILREITPEYAENVLKSVMRPEYCAMSVINPL